MNHNGDIIQDDQQLSQDSDLDMDNDDDDNDSIHVHFCGPDMSEDDILMCDDISNKISLRQFPSIIGNTSFSSGHTWSQSLNDLAKQGISNQEKRKTIAFGGHDYDFLFKGTDSPRGNIPYCDRFKLKSKFNIWKKLMQIRSETGGKSDGKVEELYLAKVEDGAIEEVKALFQFNRDDKSFEFNRNAVDLNERSALTIAIIQRNLSMCRLLLDNKVSLRDSLCHAIDQNFVEGVKLIMKYDKCHSFCIACDHSYFQVGMTPLILAAIKNNYTILKLLDLYGHKLKVALSFKQGIQHAWEFRKLRKLYWMTVSSPAYITLICEKSNRNALDHSMDVIANLREHGKMESELEEFYRELSLQVEEFMCHLLDQVQSSQDLSNLFEYQYLRSARHRFSIIMSDEKRHLNILERACSMKLFKFVNHENCQLVVTYLLYRNTPFLRDSIFLRRLIKRTVMGMLFPLWSLFYLLAPHTKLGKIMKTPSVLFECYTMSAFTFLAILILNIVTKSVDNEYLGAPPTAFEYLITLWMLGKWVEEIIECHNRGLRSYIGDWWNWNDLLQILLFTTWFILRVVDFASHQADTNQVFRLDWSVNEPRLWSVGVLAYGYVIVFLRVLGFTRTNRVLGPLRITLSKMMGDVIQFFAFFCLIMFAFGIGISELFWYYGSVQQEQVICPKVGNLTKSGHDCSTIPFSNLWSSLVSLFWGMFGYLDPTQLDFAGKHQNIETLGLILLAAFYIAVILILINMLIAMMSKSYEITSANEEQEWRFYRAVIWVRYIRGDFTSPPPMNLIPNFRYIWKQLQECWGRKKITKVQKSGDCENANNAQLESFTTCDAAMDNLTEHTNALLHRYKVNKLLGTQLTSST